MGFLQIVRQAKAKDQAWLVGPPLGLFLILALFAHFLPVGPLMSGLMEAFAALLAAYIIVLCTVWAFRRPPVANADGQ